MNHAGAVRLLERVSHVGGDAEHLIEWHRALAQPIGQRLAFQVFEDEKRTDSPGATDASPMSYSPQM